MQSSPPEFRSLLNKDQLIPNPESMAAGQDPPGEHHTAGECPSHQPASPAPQIPQPPGSTPEEENTTIPEPPRTNLPNTPCSHPAGTYNCPGNNPQQNAQPGVEQEAGAAIPPQAPGEQVQPSDSSQLFYAPMQNLADPSQPFLALDLDLNDTAAREENTDFELGWVNTSPPPASFGSLGNRSRSRSRSRSPTRGKSTPRRNSSPRQTCRNLRTSPGAGHFLTI